MATSITLPKKPKTGKVGYLTAIINTIKKNYKAGITDSKKTAKYQKDLAQKKEQLAAALEEASRMTNQKKMSLGNKLKIGAGITTGGGAGKIVYDVANKDFPTMNKGGVVKKKSYKNGGVVIIDKSGSSHYKSKGNSKAIAKKYFKGTF